MQDITQSEENLIKIMKHPLSIFVTDSLFVAKNWHERSTNSSRYILNKFSKIIGIEKLVKRATRIPAERLNLDDKKIVKEGALVSLVRFKFS